MVLAAAALWTAAQAGTGSLAGTLTDLESHPAANATVILHNKATGSAFEAATARNGRYRFAALPPGEYWLEARSAALGEGTLSGLVVAAGHEMRVQTAVAFGASATGQVPPMLRAEVRANPPPQSLMIPEPSETSAVPARNTEPPAAISLAAAPTKPLPVAVAAVPAVGKAIAPTLGVDPALAVAVRPVIPAATPTASLSLRACGVAITGAASSAARLVLESALPGAATLRGTLAPEAEAAVAESTISSEELEQLPLPGRDWRSFMSDSGAAEIAAPDDTGRDADARKPTSTVTLEGAPTGTAFGARGERRTAAADLISPARGDTAVSEVRTAGNGSGPAQDRTLQVSTRSGANRLHGQLFAFNRQNLWNAQNPYTQVLKETAAATAISVPVFTPFAYTPPDRRLTWGAAIGGPLKRNRAFWFAALDGDQRNDPAVATVRHPENFFAQPTNDEMQVLSARLGMGSANPVAEGVGAYGKSLESLNGLLGEAARTSSRLAGFARLDWRVGERQRLMVEGSGGRQDAPGGALARVSEMYGTHSFGESRASSAWALGRWEAFLTPNLLAVTQGSYEKQIYSLLPETPSPFEQGLNASTWGQLPQMVVDSRYGFTMGTPARFGKGNYPDETTLAAQEGVDWVHGPLLVKAGFEVRHSADATSRIVNHAGTYHYARVENFISDALVFAKYGLSELQNPLTTAHNCDERGKAWRDTTGQLHGLGHLPCYSYYTQTLGPTDWRLSTNDWGSYATLQWQPAKSFVLSAAVRWDREQLPPPIALVNNPGLPLTQKLPALGSEWAPRVGLAWGKLESRWPVLRASYGMYFGRTSNAVVETALTQTGSLKGDLNLFIRPTDGYTSANGTSPAPPFPYVLAGDPAMIEKPAVVEFAPGFRNPEIHQAQMGLEEKLPGHVLVQASAAASLGRRLPVTVDTNYDPAANPKTITYAVVDASGKGPIKTRQITVPFFASWPVTTGISGRLNPSYQQITAIESRANSTYELAMLDVTRYAARGLTLRAHYTYGHAMDWNPNESAYGFGGSMLDPTDFRQEYGTSGLDIRHSLSAMAIWRAPWKLHSTAGALANGWLLSGTGRYHSGLPYTMRTAGSIPRIFTTGGTAIVGLGPSMNGYGGDPRVYGVGRNTYRYLPTWKADVRVGRVIRLPYRRELELLAESFNLFNHQNVTEIETVGYTIEPGGPSGSMPTFNFLTGLKAAQTEFGQPLNVNATDFYRERQFDFGVRLRF
ncbi:MAG: carboxypeptidase regulatory-like domain-containing protein [Acidobacteriota bacterium]